MTNIDFEKIELWFKNNSGKQFRSGELDGREPREEYIKFIQYIIPNSFYEKTSNWQNSGHVSKYFWANVRAIASDKKDSYLGIAISASTDKSGQLEISMRLESENKRIGTMSVAERKQINKKLLQFIDDSRCYYADNRGSGRCSFDQAKKRIEEDYRYNDPLFKLAPNIKLTPPYTAVRADEILEEAKEVFALFQDAYYKMFETTSVAKKENTDEIKEGADKNSVVTESMNAELNTILYGPPGTGKTYHTALYAVSIIESTPIEELKKEDYSFVLGLYDMYKEEGLIEFTTFHQSYGYEEFIEGIRPVADDSGNMTYQVMPGVFKRFCERAATPVVKSLKTHSSPVVWKVSLAKTYANPIRTECLEKGHIRIGWDEYGENISEETNFIKGGKSILNAFINEMRVGDIVVSCYNESTADAIGIVTGTYEWHPEYDSYKRVRSVQWIVKGTFNITEINGGKNMTLAAVYKLNNIDIEKLYKYMSSDKETTTDNKNNYVFIIDEINRGNISKILGETITLIEPSKRKGAKEQLQVTLPYSGNNFSVPKNVYIIGTMNTADRSIAMLDTALRRRFNFKEMMPDANVMDGVFVEGISIKLMIETINNRIEFLYDREHTIGHAYFMSLKDNPTMDELANIFENKIIPLLQEYFYEDYEKIQLVLGDNKKENDDIKFIRNYSDLAHELFGTSDMDFEEKSIYRINKKAFNIKESYLLI